MTAVRAHDVKYLLHKEVFHPNGQRLVGFTQVCGLQYFLKFYFHCHYDPMGLLHCLLLLTLQALGIFQILKVFKLCK